MSRPTQKLIIFDLDGTLADTAGDLMAALNVVLARDGIAPLPVDQARTLLGAGGRALIERGYAVSGRSLDKARLEDQFTAFLAHYEAHIADHTSLFPGVKRALDRLESSGYAFAICTNKMERASIKLMKALDIDRRFRTICGQDTFGFCKPDARTLPAVAERAGSVATMSVMIGDSITDIAAAKNAGIPVIAVDFGYTDTPVTELGPDRVISHFDALPDAIESLLPAGFTAESDRPL